MLSFCDNTTYIQADATYKISLNGFPLLVLGTSDADRHFHPFGVALCSTEKQQDFAFAFNTIKHWCEVLNFNFLPHYLLADGSHAITNGFADVFGNNFFRGMCSVHVQKNLEKKFKSLWPYIAEDFYQLQTAANSNEFYYMLQLFETKMQRKNDEEYDKFIMYFKSSWCGQLVGW